MSDSDQFTEDELRMLFNAWALHSERRGFVPEDHHFADCVRLAQRGWLEQRWVNATSDLSFFWTTRAETTLDLNNLTATAKESVN